MPSTKEIKRRIKSNTSTKKITRAMQMVSAVKMRKAQAARTASMSYADLAWQLVANLSVATGAEVRHPLLETNDQAKKIGVLLITSNRGLVGSLNTNLVTHTAQYIRERGAGSDLLGEIATLGRKGRQLALRMHESIFAEFEKSERPAPISSILPISRMLIDEYRKGTYREIVVAYTKFTSTLKQTPAIKQLLPFTYPGADDVGQQQAGQSYEYLFEPDPVDVLSHLLPRIVESQIYQALLESDASEHSSRMVMMSNATDAADELITDLTLTYNQVRQANITQQLAELTAGRIALE